MGVFFLWVNILCFDFKATIIIFFFFANFKLMTKNKTIFESVFFAHRMKAQNFAKNNTPIKVQLQSVCH